MTKSKIKSSTAFIITLSVLLVLSLATTITLAYFTASRTATTTITFGANITLTVNGILPASEGGYTWAVTGATGTPSNTINAGTTAQTLQAITIATSGTQAYVAIKVNITELTPGPDLAAPYDTALWMAYAGHAGWYIYKGAGSTAIVVPTTAVSTVSSYIVGSGDVQTFAGASYRFDVNIQASDDLTHLGTLCV